MSHAESQSAFNLALAHHQAGRLRDAQTLYLQILNREPNHVEALHRLGIVSLQTARPIDAVEFFGRATALSPDHALAHSNLGIALQTLGRADEAIKTFHRAIAINPNLPGAHGNLGVALRSKGLGNEAIVEFQKAIALNPKYAEAFFNLGNALGAAVRPEEAITAYRQAIKIKPNYPQAHSNLGISLEDVGKRDEAIAAYRNAIVQDPNYAQAHNNLGSALMDDGQATAAIASYRRAITLKPDYAQAIYNLGNALRSGGKHDEAIVAYKQAITLRPDLADAFNNLGNTLKDKGQLDLAIAAYRQAMTIRPHVPEYHSNLVLAMHYQPSCDAQAIAEELARWNLQHAEPQKHLIRLHANIREPDRQLRIGYLSPDFREHVVGQNLLPLFLHRDRQLFEVTCYSHVKSPDAMTAQFEKLADRWRSISGHSDERVAQQIRDDQIDVLVDLTLHSASNRLPIFARKPAPVQVSYLGYCGSTGMTAMDCRLSDPYLDPLDVDLSSYSELTALLPRTYWCYQPWDGAAAVAELPALKNGYITFGCFNNFAKVNAVVLERWATILAAVPHSHMLVHAPAGDHMSAIIARFERCGIKGDRLQFVGQQSWANYTQGYSKIDIALDPFPFGGGITTCDALWMGVPVVTLSGETAVGRGGRSILSNIGMPELVAFTPEQYFQIAIGLAGDLDRLKSLRNGLRTRLLASPLMDTKTFVRDVETVYRRMWRTWCDTRFS